VKNLDNLKKILEIENLSDVSSIENLENYIIMKTIIEQNIHRF
jgi:hypothetical protein